MIDYRMGSYRRTRKKKHTIYCCMPPTGTKVYNFLEGTYHITTTQMNFVISGTVGEKSVLAVDRLAKLYTFADGTPITPDKLISRFKQIEGRRIIDWFAVEARVGTNTPICWAYQIPANTCITVPNQMGSTYTVNKQGIPHSTGDFILCADRENKPDFSRVIVVNGETFPDLYDLSNFKEVRKAGYLPKKGIPNSLTKGFNNTLS